MIVSTAELRAHRGAVTMVDGGFDPLHPGHLAYFRAAEALGLPVLCNVSGDDWVTLKHRPLLTQTQRGELIDAIRHVQLVHLAATPTATVLSELRPRYYAKGEDWRDRLPAEELRLCAEHGIEVVYLETVLDSSTAILARYDGDRVD
ncbi:MAG: hypothetical protein WKF41_14325 [Gaiellaceae bacterium]